MPLKNLETVWDWVIYHAYKRTLELEYDNLPSLDKEKSRKRNVICVKNSHKNEV